MFERDQDVAALWKTALLDTDDLTERIQQFTPSRKVVEELERAGWRNDAERAFRTLVLNRTKRAGILAPGASFLESGENAKGIGSRWYPDTLVKRLQEIGKHAQKIAFYEGDSMRILEPLLKGWGQKAAVFVDPPYTGKGGKRAGSRLYAHCTIDHVRLFEILDRSHSNFLMTYDGAQEIVDLIHQHGFCAVRVEMNNAHYSRLSEVSYHARRTVLLREKTFQVPNLCWTEKRERLAPLSTPTSLTPVPRASPADGSALCRNSRRSRPRPGPSFGVHSRP